MACHARSGFFPCHFISKDEAMNLDNHEPPPSHRIPSCKIRGRLIPVGEFLPRLRTLCSSLGFNNPIVTRSSESVANLADRLKLGFRSSQDVAYGEQDHIIILAARLPYEQDWGAYSGLPGQQYRLDQPQPQFSTPAEFIIPFVRQYHYAQTHIHLGCDSGGKPVAILPDALVSGKTGRDGIGLKVDIDRIAEPGTTRTLSPSAAGTMVTFTLAALFQQTLADQEGAWQPGVFTPIGQHLAPELFTFIGKLSSIEPPPYPEVAAIMPWIVSHKTPPLAATLVHLRQDFAGVRETMAATGTDDQRNLICIVGLEIDMKGFRGRKERYIVPWRACWKRHGHCYGNIFPLLQDDLFVALMNFNRVGSGAAEQQF
jgi:hypothetical protein